MESVKSLIVAAIIILVIIAGGMFFYGRTTSKTQTAVSGEKLSQNVSKTPSGALEQDITLTPNGFLPNVVNIKAGTKVKWINNSGKIGDVDSDPHPIHTSYPAMNFGQFSNGSSFELVFDKPGTYHYHNHLNPSQTGSIVVQ